MNVYISSVKMSGLKRITLCNNLCSFDGCKNITIKNGICVKHGAVVKQCSFALQGMLDQSLGWGDVRLLMKGHT